MRNILVQLKGIQKNFQATITTLSSSPSVDLDMGVLLEAYVAVSTLIQYIEGVETGIYPQIDVVPTLTVFGNQNFGVEFDIISDLSKKLYSDLIDMSVTPQAVLTEVMKKTCCMAVENSACFDATCRLAVAALLGELNTGLALAFEIGAASIEVSGCGAETGIELSNEIAPTITNLLSGVDDAAIFDMSISLILRRLTMIADYTGVPVSDISNRTLFDVFYTKEGGTKWWKPQITTGH